MNALLISFSYFQDNTAWLKYFLELKAKITIKFIIIFFYSKVPGNSAKNLYTWYVGQTLYYPAFINKNLTYVNSVECLKLVPYAQVYTSFLIMFVIIVVLCGNITRSIHVLTIAHVERRFNFFSTSKISSEIALSFSN